MKASASIPYGGMLRGRGELQEGEPNRSSRSRKLVENRGGGSVRTEMTASEGEGPSRIETGHRWRTMSACHLTGMVESPSDQRRDDSGMTAHSRRFVEMRGIPRGTM